MRFLPSKRLILICLGLIWLELSILPLLSIWQVKPDFFFIFLVFYAFRVDYRSLFPLAFVFGIAKDLLANSFFGLEVASYVSSSFLLQFLAVRFDREKRWIQLVSLFVFSFTSLILFSIFALLVQKQYGLNAQVMIKAFLISLYTTFFGFLLFPFLDRWLRATLRQKQYELF